MPVDARSSSAVSIAESGAAAVRDVGLRFAVDQIRRLVDAGAPGIHLYTLNKADLCLRLISECGL